jgi:hypothetical protein
MSGRLIHADEWIGDAGFRVPKLPPGAHQPLWVPALPTELAWLLVTVMVISGLMASAGYKTRKSLLTFVCTLVFVALSDRPSAFTVSKIGPVISLALACGPAGTRFGVDAYLARRNGAPAGPATVALGPVRFLQCFVCTFYCASGIAKAGGDWLTTPLVLYSHLHDSYQTILSFVLAEYVPGALWTPMQYTVLVYEMGSPILFGWKRTRPFQLVYGVGMHVGIGTMFGPVIWFACLMITLLLGCFAPEAVMLWLDKAWMRRMDQWLGREDATAAPAPATRVSHGVVLPAPRSACPSPPWREAGARRVQPRVAGGQRKIEYFTISISLTHAALRSLW